jgi:NAD(P)-dependent dehydrogenase (short-subunit alcohol dehydrogenase family)
VRREKDLSMTEHRLALVVGATRGIGLGVTKEFLQRGWYVIATARDPAKATELQNWPPRIPDVCRSRGWT